jgi:hypothetical protein
MLENSKKPFKMTVEEVANRLRHLNKLMSKFPGADNAPPYDDEQLKVVFYKMMLSDWQVSFLKSGRELTDPALSFLDLVRYMTIAETTYNAERERDAQANERRVTFARSPGRGRGQRFGRRRNNPQGGRGEPSSQRRRTTPNTGRGGGGRGSGNGNCPFHPGLHDWESCFANPHGSNYRPGYRPVPPGGRGSGSRNQRQDAQMADEHEDLNQVDSNETFETTDEMDQETETAEPEEDQHWLDNLGDPSEWSSQN